MHCAYRSIPLLALLSALCIATNPTGPPEAFLNRRLTQYETRLMFEMQAIPFIDFVSRRNDPNDDLFLYMLENRPEMQSIDWKGGNIEAIAQQLESICKVESDTSWRNKFNACLRAILRIHDWDVDKMQQLQDYLSQCNLRRRKQEYRRRARIKGKTEEEKKKQAESRSRTKSLRRVDRKQGRGLPLLVYMNLPYNAGGRQLEPPEVWHEEALKYRDMYRSCKSFVQALRCMFDKLGYSEGETINLRKDERNVFFEPWEWSQRTDNSKPASNLQNTKLDERPSHDSRLDCDIFDRVQKSAVLDQKSSDRSQKETFKMGNFFLHDEIFHPTSSSFNFGIPEYEEDFVPASDPIEDLPENIEHISTTEWDDWSPCR